MPRAGLSPAAVTELALAVVDDAGLAGLTLAAVATRAGVAVPSLYKHVESLGALRRSVAIVSVTELTGAMADAAEGAAGPEALRRVATALRAFAHRHPGRYAAVQAAADPNDAEDVELSTAGGAAVAVIAGVLSDFGLTVALTIDGVRIVRSAVHGFVVLELEGGFGLPDDLDTSFGLLIDTVIAGLERLAA